jgi:uncharacterized protein
MHYPDTVKKILKLHGILESMEKVVVAFSGGVDSAFLLKTSHALLGERVTAVTAASEVVPASELEAAQKFTAHANMRHVILRIHLFENENFLANRPDRCYVCKLEVFRKIKEFAGAEHILHVIEGSHHDDADDYRPGGRALLELGIRSPLSEAGLTKEEIRQESKKMGLPMWDKPANPCLATRIPYNTNITQEVLEKIDKAEKYIHDLGFREVRVRYHGNLARIEVPRHMRARLLEEEISTAIAGKFKKFGFAFVAVDIEGYRTGSMNEDMSQEGLNGQG